MPDPITPPGPDVWSIRHVALSCDHPAGCDTVIDADVRADTFAQALPALIAHGRAYGWGVTDDGRVAHCPDHTGPTAHGPAALLGLPGEVPGA